MSSWGCPHDWNGQCQRVPGRVCDPGMKGCVLFGRFRWADESKNRPRPTAHSADKERDDSSDRAKDNANRAAE